jgi:3-hydroxyisobutyrate dehydrogenase-like beta-hydroxyacid dehydrogenase
LEKQHAHRPARAALAKLCVNALGGAMITGFAEALALGAAGGLEAVRRMLAEAAETGRADKDIAAVAELCLEWSRKK